MERLVITGGIPLHGEVTVGGAKNAVLPLMAATLLANGTHHFSNVPNLMDVRTMQKLLRVFGLESELADHHLTLHTHKPESLVAPYDLVKTMRASVVVLGPLLARFGKAKVSLPGGCAIGARPIDLHLKGFEKLGAKISIQEGYVEAEAKKLKGADIHFDKVTVTGTENLLMAAVLAEGTTRLTNAAKEPEVTDLANYLCKMGAQIEGAGTETILVHGVSTLKPAEHTVIADRIVAGTFLMAGAITRGSVTVSGCPAKFLEAVLDKLTTCGCKIEANHEKIFLKSPHALTSSDITTTPYPGFITDLQAQFMALMTLANGTSTIHETIFENRFQHALELQRLGADIRIGGHQAIVKGVKKLTGAPLMATDLRASASLVLAGLAAEGTTIVDRCYHIDRGYEHIEESLQKLGASISRK